MFGGALQRFLGSRTAGTLERLRACRFLWPCALNESFRVFFGFFGSSLCLQFFLIVFGCLNILFSFPLGACGIHFNGPLFVNLFPFWAVCFVFIFGLYSSLKFFLSQQLRQLPIFPPSPLEGDKSRSHFFYR
ncbi:MAG: hypothetical protein CM15mV103_450 [uncultured marine virus]|nr:MAG: hypothetical protein CM15mV103_450 [uncultured marine virus]